MSPNRILATLLAGAVTLSTSMAFPLRDKPDVFFAAGPTAPEGVPSDKLYLKGRQMLFSLSGELGERNLEEAKRIGVSIVGAGVKDAEKVGLKVGYPVGVLRQEGGLAFDDAESLAKEIAAQVKAVASNPAIAFWNLTPGEFQHRDSKDKEYLRVATKVIGESDPLKRPIWTYAGPEVNTGYLTNLAPWVDLLGKSLLVDSSKSDSRILVRWSMERAVEGTNEAETEAIPVAMPVLSKSLTEVGVITNSAKHDIYLSLVLGAKGVIALPENGERNADAWNTFLSSCLKAAEELLGSQKLSELFLYAERRSDLEIDIVDGPSELEMTPPGGKESTSYSSVSHLDLAYGKERFLVLVNSALKPVTVMVGGMPYNAVNAESLLEKAVVMPIAEGEFEVELKPLEVKVYRFTRR